MSSMSSTRKQVAPSLVTTQTLFNTQFVGESSPTSVRSRNVRRVCQTVGDGLQDSSGEVSPSICRNDASDKSVGAASLPRPSNSPHSLPCKPNDALGARGTSIPGQKFMWQIRIVKTQIPETKAPNFARLSRK
ncbi:hypothetical protein PGT21_018007 [Puccinia graminis f. sp. tritici]|uniref:Uncharacterized protein n=1 Tax=Puccinia graminis f. sp. tritici TaxID=56615 RepID=A0A5B0QNG9_PUCGR|nr:hypothetical protein PGT21_018007 [Puccinia graminis f. sp. tritici]